MGKEGKKSKSFKYIGYLLNDEMNLIKKSEQENRTNKIRLFFKMRSLFSSKLDSDILRYRMMIFDFTIQCGGVGVKNHSYEKTQRRILKEKDVEEFRR